MGDTLLGVVCLVITIVYWGLIIWIVLSWIVSFGRLSFDHPVRRFYDTLSRFVEPVLRPLRNVIPPVRIGGAALDLSPLVVFVALIILQRIIC